MDAFITAIGNFLGVSRDQARRIYIEVFVTGFFAAIILAFIGWIFSATGIFPSYNLILFFITAITGVVIFCWPELLGIVISIGIANGAKNKTTIEEETAKAMRFYGKTFGAIVLYYVLLLIYFYQVPIYKAPEISLTIIALLLVLCLMSFVWEFTARLGKNIIFLLVIVALGWNIYSFGKAVFNETPQTEAAIQNLVEEQKAKTDKANSDLINKIREKNNTGVKIFDEEAESFNKLMAKMHFGQELQKGPDQNWELVTLTRRKLHILGMRI